MNIRSYTLICLFPLLFTLPSHAVTEEKGFSVTSIDKTAKEINPDSIASPSSPLDYYRMRTWIRLNGKESLWGTISTKRFKFDSEYTDKAIDEERAKRILDEKVLKIICYNDSSAAVITQESSNCYLINYTWIEEGRWVNGGQGLAYAEEDIEKDLKKGLPLNLNNIPRIGQINQMPADVSPFAKFVESITQSPEEFLLSELKAHRLVINGEYHRRKVSWDMLKRLISLPEFPHITGTIFMELPSRHQPTIDAFFADNSLDKERILAIFRDEQPNGWWDKGEFEFLCDLWKLNRQLPADKKVKVVLADYQIPYSEVTSTEETMEKEDRNTHMADVIYNHITSTSDTRNHLFLVGCGHAYKSGVPGAYSTPENMQPSLTAGAQLAERLGSDTVFTVFQHVMSGDNSGRNKEKVRGGVFDRAFALNGNRPIGFRLKDTPFGNEPFDGIYEMKYDYRTGSYADNFDGYLFLHSLEDEPQNPPLLDIFSPEFITEMKRRAVVLNTENHKWMWFGTHATDMTAESIAAALNQ